MFLFNWIKQFVSASAHVGWTVPAQTSVCKMSSFVCSSQYCRPRNTAATYRLKCCRVRVYLQHQQLYCDYCYEELKKQKRCVCGDRSCCMEAEKVDDIIQRKRQREAVKKEQEAVRKLIMEEEQRIARKEQEEKLQEERLALWKEHERKLAKTKQNDAADLAMKQQILQEEERLALWKEHERKFMLKQQILQAADLAQFLARNEETISFEETMAKALQEWFAKPQ